MHKITLEVIVDLTSSDGAKLLQELVSIRKGENSTLTITEEVQTKNAAAPAAKSAPTRTTAAKTTQAAPVVEEPIAEEPIPETQTTAEAEPQTEAAAEILDFSGMKLTIEQENEVREIQRATIKAHPLEKDKIKAKLNSYGADTLTQLLENSSDKVAEYVVFLKSL